MQKDVFVFSNSVFYLLQVSEFNPKKTFLYTVDRTKRTRVRKEIDFLHYIMGLNILRRAANLCGFCDILLYYLWL